MSNYVVDMRIDGRTVRKLNHNGRTYLPVEHGREFTLRITNHTRQRVCAVVSVDGLSVMSGEKASHSDSGYIIEAHTSQEVHGWRRGDEEVAVFEVSTEGGSYASRTGKGGNVGVVGVVIIPEKRRKRVRQSQYISPNSWEREEPTSGGIVLPKDDGCMFACDQGPTRSMGSKSFSKSISAQSAGTGYGRSREDRVNRVHFDRDPSKKSVITLYYDTVNGLKEKGVPVDTVVGCPNPFPAEPSDLYCPPPPGDWR